MEINKQFWEQVLKEYEGSGEIFICHGSITFKSVWKGGNQKIRDLATQFLKENPIKDTKIFTNSAALFDVSNYSDREVEIIKFKTHFIKWSLWLCTRSETLDSVWKGEDSSVRLEIREYAENFLKHNPALKEEHEMITGTYVLLSSDLSSSDSTIKKIRIAFLDWVTKPY